MTQAQQPEAAHIVLDLETLSTDPHATVASIGAVALTAQGGFVAEFHKAIDTGEQLGRHVSPSTCEWWDEQSNEARVASILAPNPAQVVPALKEFTDWVLQIADPKKVKVWGNGSGFDNVILSSLFADYPELERPWAFWNDRDMRTVLDLHPDAKDVGDFAGVKHNALHDARHEAKQLAKVLEATAQTKCLHQIAEPAAPQAVQPAVPLPLLVRDIARDVGITVPQACIALKPLGNYSTNAAVTSEMAQLLRDRFPAPAHPSEGVPAAQSDMTLSRACDLLSMTVITLMGFRETVGYTDNSPIAGLVSDAVEFLQPWPEKLPTATQPAAQGLDAQLAKLSTSYKELSGMFHDQVVAQQAAWIEWQHGSGAEAAMQWIENGLCGPGHIPDEDDPYGKDSQAWFDANRSDPLPTCHCGKPSNQLWMGHGFCSEAHYTELRAAQAKQGGA